MSSRFFFPVVAFIATLAAACLGGTTEAVASGPYYTIAAYGGTLDSMTVAASSATNMRALFTHAGTPTPDVPVAWTPKGGNSRVVNPAVATDSLGVASAVWVVSDSVGSDTLTLAAFDGTQHIFFARVVAGPASLIVRVTASPDSVAAGTSVVLKAKVTDRTGNAVASATVNWSATSGTLNPASATTDASGMVSTTFTPPGAGTFSVTADLPNQASIIFVVVAS